MQATPSGSSAKKLDNDEFGMAAGAQEICTEPARLDGRPRRRAQQRRSEIRSSHCVRECAAIPSRVSS